MSELIPGLRGMDGHAALRLHMMIIPDNSCKYSVQTVLLAPQSIHGHPLPSVALNSLSGGWAIHLLDLRGTNCTNSRLLTHSSHTAHLHPPYYIGTPIPIPDPDPARSTKKDGTWRTGSVSLACVCLSLTQPVLSYPARGSTTPFAFVALFLLFSIIILSPIFSVLLARSPSPSHHLRNQPIRPLPHEVNRRPSHRATPFGKDPPTSKRLGPIHSPRPSVHHPRILHFHHYPAPRGFAVIPKKAASSSHNKPQPTHTLFDFERALFSFLASFPRRFFILFSPVALLQLLCLDDSSSLFPPSALAFPRTAPRGHLRPLLL